MRNTKKPVLIELADILEADIRKKKLQKGSSYMNAAETAAFLGVSGSTANRALQILAGRDVVVRARKRGTIVNNLNSEQSPRVIERVQMVQFMDEAISDSIMIDPVVVGIQNRLPRSHIQFNYLPRIGYYDHFMRLLDEAEKCRPVSGIVLTGSAYTAQRLLEERMLPSIIHGYVRPAITKLSSITLDYEMAGKLCGEFCVQNKIKNIAIVLPLRPPFTGDFKFQCAITEVLAEAGYPLGSVRVHSLSDDRRVMHAWLNDNYAGCDGLALVCHPGLLNTKPWEILQKMGLPQKSFAVIKISEPGDNDIYMKSSSIVRITSTVTAMQVGYDIADVLVKQAHGDFSPRNIILPVTI